MKHKKTNEPSAAASPKGKVKVKSLKLNKETSGDLSAKAAAAVKGGANFSRAVSGAY